MSRPLRNFVGVDDGPFAPDHRGDVPMVGAVFTGDRLDGVLTGRVRRDGRNATARIAAMIAGSRFNPKVVLLGGIALGGFNVVDVRGLHRQLGLPVLVVARRRPDLAAIERALRERVPGGRRKWALIEQAGPMERCGAVWVQRAGLSPGQARAVLRDTTLHGNLPEPLRTAHLVAGALVTGHSTGRA